MNQIKKRIVSVDEERGMNTRNIAAADRCAVATGAHGSKFMKWKWKIPTVWLLCALVVSLALVALLRQTHLRRDAAINMTPVPCTSGAGRDGAVNRCYDDGYVYVDVSGNADGYTTHWGYRDSSQIQNGQIVFHRRTNLNADTVQVVVDTYNLGNILPPLAPYAGSFQGPGPCLFDAPCSQSTNVYTLPLLAIQNVDAPYLVVSGPNETSSRTPLDLELQHRLAKH